MVDAQNAEQQVDLIQPAVQPIMSNNSLEVFDKLAQTETGKVINAATNQTALDLIKNDEKVKERVEENAKTLIDTHLETQRLEAEDLRTEAKRKRTKFARRVFGLNDDISNWQQRIVDFGSSVWFVIYVIIAFFTIVPIGVFSEGLTKILRKGWVAILVSIMVYTAIVTAPLWAVLIRG